MNFHSRLSRGSCNRLFLIDYRTYSSSMVMLWHNFEGFMNSWIFRPKWKWPELYPNTVVLLIFFIFILFFRERREKRNMECDLIGCRAIWINERRIKISEAIIKVKTIEQVCKVCNFVWFWLINFCVMHDDINYKKRKISLRKNLSVKR